MAASSDGSPAERADRDRVPMASSAVRGLGRGAPSTVAHRGTQWNLWSAGPGSGGVVYRSVPLIQTYDAADEARGICPTVAYRDHQPTGAGYRGRVSHASRRSLCLR